MHLVAAHAFSWAAETGENFKSIRTFWALCCISLSMLLTSEASWAACVWAGKRYAENSHVKQDDGLIYVCRRNRWFLANATVINILAARYGVPGGGAAASATEPVKQLCEKKVSCSVLSSNGLVGDPAWGIVKVLDISYICQRGGRQVSGPTTASALCRRRPPASATSSS